MLYNIFRYGVHCHKDPQRLRIGGHPNFFDPEYDYIETRYAVCVYRGQGYGYETPNGEVYNSFREVPYTLNESTARNRAYRRWGFSKLIDSNNW